jgi:hypothetical protein
MNKKNHKQNTFIYTEFNKKGSKTKIVDKQ